VNDVASVGTNNDDNSVLLAIHGATDALNSSSVPMQGAQVELRFSVPIVQP
jgi:hypothetical protein